MKLTKFIVAIAAITLAVPVAAQEKIADTPPKASKTAQVKDSLDLTLSPELQKSLDELARVVQALAVRVATDPQLRMAAMHVASGMVVTAQQVVTEHSEMLHEALKTAAERIANVQSIESREPKKRQ